MERDEKNDLHLWEEAILLKLMEYNELHNLPCSSTSLPPSAPIEDSVPFWSNSHPPSAPPDDSVPCCSKSLPPSAPLDDSVPSCSNSLPPAVPLDDDQNKPSGQTKRWNPFLVDDAEMLPNNLIRSFKKPKRERPNPFSTNPFYSMLLSPTTEKTDFLIPPKNCTETCPSITQDDKIAQLDIIEPLSSCETSNDSQKPTFKVDQVVMEFPDPPGVLDAIDAKIQIEEILRSGTNRSIVKPTPVFLTCPEQRAMGFNQMQLKFSDYIDRANRMKILDNTPKNVHVIQPDIRGGSKFQPPSVPRNSPKEVINIIEETEDSCDGIYSTTEEEVQPLDFSGLVYNPPQRDGLRQPPKITMNQSKKYNYVMVESEENEANNSSKTTNKTKFRPIIRNVPIDECLTFGKIQVFKDGVSHCINLLLSVFDAFDRTETLSNSLSYQVLLESNVIECINTLISFIGNPPERDKLMMLANKGNIFIDAKEKYNASVEGKKKKTQKKDIERPVLRPMPILIPCYNKNKSNCPGLESARKSVGTRAKCTDDVRPMPRLIPCHNKNISNCPSLELTRKSVGTRAKCTDDVRPMPRLIPCHNKNISNCPSLELTRKSVGTQVKCTNDVKKKPLPIPIITVNRPKCPSPCPSPYPSPKFNSKYKGGLKYCRSNGNKTDPKERENTPACFEPLEPQDKAIPDKTRTAGNKSTPVSVNGDFFTHDSDNRLNKTGLSTFSPKVSKQVRQFHNLQPMTKKFHDDSFSSYEMPKSMMPFRNKKSFSTSNLSDVRPTVPTYSEVDIDTESVNSISTVTNDIVYTDFTKQKNSPQKKEGANQISPLYLIQNKKNTQVKANPFSSLFKKVSKPFKKSTTNIDKKDIVLKTFYANTESVKSKKKEDENISETEQLGTASVNALTSTSGRSLQVPSPEESVKRNRNTQSWLEAQNDMIRAKTSQSNLAENKSNTDKEVGFEDQPITYV